MLKSFFSLGIFLLIIIGFLFYVGFFSKVEITEKEMGPYYMVYENHVGPYQDTGKIQDEIYYKLLSEEGIETFKGFGIYYDNPQKVDKDKLRSDVGCILEGANIEKINDLQKNNYKLKKLDKINAIVTEFPFRNSVSIMAGVFRVYPKINAYMAQKGYNEAPVMEIYDVPNKKIIYVIEILK